MSKKQRKRIAELEQDSRTLSGKILNLQRNFELLFKDVKQEQARADIAVSQRFEALNTHFGIFKAGTIPSETANDSLARDGAKLDFEQVDFVRLGRNWGKSGDGMSKSMFEGQDKTKCAGCQNIENVLNKSTLDKLKQNEPKQDKTEQEKPAQTEPITPEKEQELMAQLNAELAKFASLEAFNAERKNKSLPPVDKLEFDKAKSCFDYALAAAKLLRPQWYDRINQIKIPKSEQPETEPKQDKKYMCSGEAQIRNAMANLRNIEPFKSDDDSKYMSDFQVAWRYAMLGIRKSEQPEAEPKQPEFSEQVSPNIDYYVTRKDGRIMEQKKDGYYTWWVHGTYMPYTSFSSPKQAIDAIEKYIKFAYYRADKDTTIPTLNDFGITQISRMKPGELAQGSDGADSPKRACESWGKTVLNNADETKEEPRETVKMTARQAYDERRKLGQELIESEQNLAAKDEPKQPEIHQPDRTKATLNKMVLSHIKEMEFWLSMREHSTAEITKAIQTLVDDLGLHLADFRLKVLDLGRVEPCKVDLRNSELGEVEPKETEQNSEGESWVIYDKVDKVWAAKCSDGGFYWATKQDEQGVLEYAAEDEAKKHYVRLISRGLIGGMHRVNTAVIRKEKQPQTDQPSPEKDSEKQG